MKKKKTAPKKSAKKKAQKPFLKKKPSAPSQKAVKRLEEILKAAQDESETVVSLPSEESETVLPAVRSSEVRKEVQEEDSPLSVILSMKDLARESEYELEAFTPVKEDSSDKDTTVSDLALLNNQLALCNAALPHVQSIQTLCSLSTTVQNLIRTRRGVKKLEYGSPKQGNVGRVFEVIE